MEHSQAIRDDSRVLKFESPKPNSLAPGASGARQAEGVRSLGRTSYHRCSKEDFAMRTNLDLTPYRRATVGFDRLFDMLEGGLGKQAAEDYPPFDLQQDGEDGYRITLAVAGFRADEIDITAQQN